MAHLRSQPRRIWTSGTAEGTLIPPDTTHGLNAAERKRREGGREIQRMTWTDREDVQLIITASNQKSRWISLILTTSTFTEPKKDPITNQSAIHSTLYILSFSVYGFVPHYLFVCCCCCHFGRWGSSMSKRLALSKDVSHTKFLMKCKKKKSWLQSDRAGFPRRR